MDGLDHLVTENPGTVALAIIVLLAFSKLIAGTVVWLGRRELTTIKENHQGHEARIVKLEEADEAHAVILTKLGYISTQLKGVAEEVKGHNKEAEGWKRTIVGHGVRIESLEGKR